MLAIPLSPNIICSLSKFLKLEILESENKWFCPWCNCLAESTRETSIISLGSILVIQVSRFSISDSKPRKDQQLFNCFPESELNVPYISVFACVSVSLCLCVFLLVFVCIYVLPVASVLSALVMYLVWLCFSKTIRVIHYFYPLKNPCKREERLLGILSLES